MSDLKHYIGHTIRWLDTWGVWEGVVTGAGENVLRVRMLGEELWHYAPDMRDIEVVA